jgi:hypothetical protein
LRIRSLEEAVQSKDKTLKERNAFEEEDDAQQSMLFSTEKMGTDTLKTIFRSPPFDADATPL